MGYIVGLLVLGAFFGAIGSVWGTASTPLYWFSALCGVGVGIQGVAVLIRARADYWQVLGWAAKDLAQLPDDRWQTLGITHPKIRGRWPNGMLEYYYDDTNARAEHLVAFMMGSDSQQIYPERNCNAELPRWAWREIRVNMEGYGYIIPDSHAGSHSWRWATPQTFANLRALFGDWLNPNLVQMEN